MKHQILVRVFSIVLAIMCLLLLINGLTGFGKAANEYRERTETAQRYEDRIENFRQLDAKLSNSVSYDEVYEILSKKLEEHEGEASRHKTDLAEYSAKKGGYTMAFNMIQDAKGQLADAKQQVEYGKKQLAEKEAQLAALIEFYDKNKDTVAAVLAAAQSGQAECQDEANRLNGVSEDLQKLMAEEPREPQKPAEPEPVGEPAKPTEPEDKSDEAAMEKYETEYQEYLRQKELYDQYLVDRAAYDKAMDDYNAGLESYKTEHEKWAESCTEIKANADFCRSAAVLNNQLAAMKEIADSIQSLPDIGGSDIGAALDQAIVEQLNKLAAADTGSMSNEEFLAAAEMLSGTLSGISGSCAAIGELLGALDSRIAEAQTAMDDAKAQLAMGEAAVQKGEAELQKQLANLWYNLGELDKDGSRLEAEKGKLDRESDELSKQLLSADELRELERKHISACLLLTNVPEVKAMVNDGGDIVRSAEKYLADYKAQTGKLHSGRICICVLALAGAAAGFAGIPAAFEKTGKRSWLIAPIVLCLVCAAAADGLNMYLGLGQMYTALAAALFAAIQLALALPKKRI